MDQNLVRIDLRANAASAADVAEIAGQPVAQIDHGVDRNGPRDLACQFDAGNKAHVPPGETAAERTADVDRVTRPRPLRNTGEMPACAENRDAQPQFSIPRSGVPADDRAVEWVRRFAHAAIQFLRVIHAAATRQRGCGYSGGGKSGHRGAIGKVAVHRLAANVPGGMKGRVEMNAVENLICSNNQQVRRVPTQDRQIVPRSDSDQAIGHRVRPNPVDKILLAGHTPIVEKFAVVRMRRIAVIALFVATEKNSRMG